MVKNTKWEPCPQCGSNRVESRGGCFFAILGFCLTGISIWLLFIPPIGIAGIVTGLLFLIISPFMRGFLQCQDCKYSWKYPHKEKPQKEV